MSVIPVFRIHLQLAQPARLLLEYTGTKYENKFFSCGEGNLPVLTIIILNTQVAQVPIQHTNLPV